MAQAPQCGTVRVILCDQREYFPDGYELTSLAGASNHPFFSSWVEQRDQNRQLDLSHVAYGTFAAWMDLLRLLRTSDRIKFDENPTQMIRLAIHLQIYESILDGRISTRNQELEDILSPLFYLNQANYSRLVDKMCTALQFPQPMLRAPSCHKFKRHLRKFKRFYEWMLKYRIPRCICANCSKFRHDRLVQMHDWVYPTPYFGYLQAYKMFS